MAQKLLILDLDETLIHASQSPLAYPHDFETALYFVYKRPYLGEFLDFSREHFRVAVWTTAGEEFAATVIQHAFPPGYPLEFIWSRDRCTPKFDPNKYEHGYIKNLQKVKRRGFDLDHVIMVDDTPAKLAKNYGNLVRVREFIGDPRDDELVHLMPYLLHLKTVDKVRQIEKRGWQNKQWW